MGEFISILEFDGNVISVIGLLFWMEIRSDNEGELSNYSFLTVWSNYSSLCLNLMNPKLGGDNLYLSSTICCKFNCPIIVSSGCSASEKNGRKYLFFYCPLITHKTVEAIILRKGLHNSLTFFPTYTPHFYIFNYFKAAGEKRIYLNCLFS